MSTFPTGGGRYGPGNYLRQPGGGLDRSVGDYGSGDPAGEPFLTEATKNTGQHFRLGVVNNLVGASICIRTHTHVQWPLPAEGKTSPSLVKLVAGNAQVKQDPRYPFQTLGIQYPIQPAEIVFHQPKTIPIGGASDRVGITVYAEHIDRLVEVVEQSSRMSTPAESSIDDYSFLDG